MIHIRVRRILYGITRQKKVIKAEEASKYHSRTLGNRITHQECGNQGSCTVMNNVGVMKGVTETEEQKSGAGKYVACLHPKTP